MSCSPPRCTCPCQPQRPAAAAGTVAGTRPAAEIRVADLRFTPAEAAALRQHAASASRTGAVARARELNLIP